MPLLGDVRDFNAFLIPLRNTIVAQLGGRGHLPICLTDLRPCYIVELGSLHVIFLEMLEKIDECLKKMEILVSKSTGEIHSLRSGWGQYLSILKALNTFSKLYKGAEENVLSVMRLRQVALNALIRISRRSDDHRWILDHKDLTSFESRRHLTLMLLPELKDEYEHLFEMLIDREQLLAESFEYISKADVKDLHGGGLFMEFKNEEATGPGVLREWFCLVCQAIFNPQNALFLACPDDNRRFFPNPDFVLRKLRTSGLILKHVRGLDDSNWMHILFKVLLFHDFKWGTYVKTAMWDTSTKLSVVMVRSLLYISSFKSKASSFFQVTMVALAGAAYKTFECLVAHLWRGITRVRGLPDSQKNCALKFLMSTSAMWYFGHTLKQEGIIFWMNL